MSRPASPVRWSLPPLRVVGPCDPPPRCCGNLHPVDIPAVAVRQAHDSAAREAATSLKAWPIVAVCVSIVVLIAFPHAAIAQDELRIARVVRSVGTDAEVLVAVPRTLSGRTLGVSAFTVTVDGNPVTATVTRANGRGFDVALVIETSSGATEELFVATKAAAVEFILQQPA